MHRHDLCVLGAGIALICATLTGCGTPHGGGPRDKPTASATADPFPPDFDWPADPQTLQAEIDAGNTPALRAHSWYLWAGLNTLDDTGRPIWWSWPTSSQAFPYQQPPPQVAEPVERVAKRGLRLTNAANTPINLPAPKYVPPTVVDGTCQGSTTNPNLPDGLRFQSNGDIMIAGVIYNEDAFEWIANSNLADSNNLTQQWGGGSGSREIAQFPSTAMVLKHMYWPARGDDFTALPVWDPQSYPADWPNYVGYEYWKRTVIIDPRLTSPKPGMTGVTKWLYNVLDANGNPLGPKVATGQVYPVNVFYNQMIDGDTLASFSPGDRAILDASACWLYNRPFQAGDYLVTVAMHMITKEIPQWTLQSAWWHDKPNFGPFAKDRPDISPAQAPGPWRHYLITVEYGIESSPGMLPMSFNPYIELAAAHPIQTNCRNCHLRAAWPRQGAVPSAPSYASYEAAGGPGALVDISADDPIFSQQLLLDFQWAVSDRANTPPPQR
jgi:hypothetical protein